MSRTNRRFNAADNKTNLTLICIGLCREHCSASPGHNGHNSELFSINENNKGGKFSEEPCLNVTEGRPGEVDTVCLLPDCNNFQLCQSNARALDVVH